MFLLPPSFDVLETRLREPQRGHRGADPPAAARRRAQEVAAVSGVRLRGRQRRRSTPASSALRAIIVAERADADAMGGEAASMLASFGVVAGDAERLSRARAAEGLRSSWQRSRSASRAASAPTRPSRSRAACRSAGTTSSPS
ncbi:MAG: hypothetical protein MZV64_73080 [Ignavibacteriales bacterium]|nr:hypothetical protein [Ignavibacteriales bacterium]